VKGTLAIYRRELAGLFLAPLAWILFFFVLLYQAYFFLYALGAKSGEVNGALVFVLGAGTPFWLLAIFLPPLLTMRMISEESRSGLLEFLLTAPVSDAAVVLGKALAATTFLALVWASTFLFAALCQALGAAPDWGWLLAVWIGSTLVSALFSALGLIASALFATPLLAAFMAILVNIALFGLPFLARTWRGGVLEHLAGFFEHIDLLAHFQGSFLAGALDTTHVLFFVAWTAAALFLAVRLVESRRWLG
jgi:ABC-2 type transport system permease protein